MRSITNEYMKWEDYGVMTEPIPDGVPIPDFGKIKIYCRENGKTLADMTQEEIDQFLIFE